MIYSSTLVFDIEASSEKPEEAEISHFGAYSYQDKRYYIYDYTQKEEIRQLIKSHKYVVGFNNIHYDQPIINKYFNEDIFRSKISIDLYKILTPYHNGKNRLTRMGYNNLSSYSLNNIVKTIGLDDEGEKGDVDYNLFKKQSWNAEETKQINKYLKQDIKLTKKLFEWFESQFTPLLSLMHPNDRMLMNHIRKSIPSLVYSIICYKAGLKPEYDDQKRYYCTNCLKKIKCHEQEKPQECECGGTFKREASYSGGHHIENRQTCTKGNIVYLDYSSAYPHSIMQCNLFSPAEEGWSGDGYYKVEGTYNNKKQGLIESVIKEIYYERLKAKKNKDKVKDKSYKLIINNAYGLTGSSFYKQLYNKVSASDCTSIVRTWMKRTAKFLEENGFEILYGFTDGMYVLIPENLNENVLLFLVDKILDEFKQHVPFPMDTFKMDVDERIKMLWVYRKNMYLKVTQNNEVEIKDTLLNTNTPRAVLEVWNNHMKPKIVRELDVNFTKEELEEELKKIIKQNPKIACEKYSVNDPKNYKNTTSLFYQIAYRYGKGKHYLITNKANVGAGKSKKYCTYEEFVQNDLTIDDIDISGLMKRFKPFIKTKQTKLKQENTK